MNVEKIQAEKMHAIQLAQEQMSQNDGVQSIQPVNNINQQDVSAFNSVVENKPPINVLPTNSDLNADAKLMQSPGDEILNTIQKVSEMQRENMEKINNKLSDISKTNNPSMADLIFMQKDMIEFQLSQDLLTKGVDKVVQGAQTLFRNQ